MTTRKKRTVKPKKEEVKEVPKEPVASSVLDDLGKVISETIALKQMIVGLEESLQNTQENIRVNEQELARMANLGKQTEGLREKTLELTKQIHDYKSELNTRVNKLKTFNMNIPLNDDDVLNRFARGSVNMS